MEALGERVEQEPEIADAGCAGSDAVEEQDGNPEPASRYRTVVPSNSNARVA
jgi:hypothetical protein